MSKTMREIHNNYCDYMVQKASAPIFAVKKQNTYKGISTNGMTRNELIFALAK